MVSEMEHNTKLDTCIQSTVLSSGRTVQVQYWGSRKPCQLGASYHAGLNDKSRLLSCTSSSRDSRENGIRDYHSGINRVLIWQFQCQSRMAFALAQAWLPCRVSNHCGCQMMRQMMVRRLSCRTCLRHGGSTMFARLHGDISAWCMLQRCISDPAGANVEMSGVSCKEAVVIHQEGMTRRLEYDVGRHPEGMGRSPE